MKKLVLAGLLVILSFHSYAVYGSVTHFSSGTLDHHESLAIGDLTYNYYEVDEGITHQ